MSLSPPSEPVPARQALSRHSTDHHSTDHHSTDQPPTHPDSTLEKTMDWTLEVVVLPVSDIDASVAFYRDKLGFALDHDTRNEHMHVVQLTPPGSGCSIVFGDLPGQTDMAPGSMRGLQLVVADAATARQELLDRGVDASEVTVFDER